MANKTNITPALAYFFKSLERRSDSVKNANQLSQQRFKEVEFGEVEQFFRSLKTQNIFIHTVGMNGKAESAILSKAIFSMGSVVRVYYSNSFDDSKNGFILITPDAETQTIYVERLHGLRPKPEMLYHSLDQMKVIKFMTRWLLRRIDWKKTKLNNLDLYKLFVDARKKEEETRLQAQLDLMSRGIEIERR